MDAGSTSPGNLPVAHPGRAGLTGSLVDQQKQLQDASSGKHFQYIPIHFQYLPIFLCLKIAQISTPSATPVWPKSTSVGILKKPHSFILVLNCRLATRLTRKGSVMKQASEHQLSLPPVDSGNKIHVKLLLTCGKDNTRRYLRWTVEMWCTTCKPIRELFSPNPPPGIYRSPVPTNLHLNTKENTRHCTINCTEYSGVYIYIYII